MTYKLDDYVPRGSSLRGHIHATYDELVEVFEADAFHAGMDEVFYLGEDQCPRCSGRDKAELFAGEVNKLYCHLSNQNKELWIWGDRLIDGKTTGLGMWQASMNNTARAIDLIPKEVVICDWHYKIAVPSSVLFAMKGFRVITCPYQTSEVALTQLQHFLWQSTCSKDTLKVSPKPDNFVIHQECIPRFHHQQYVQ